MLHPVFVAGVPILAAAFVATVFIRELPRWYAEFCAVADILAGRATMFTPHSD